MKKITLNLVLSLLSLVFATQINAVAHDHEGRGLHHQGREQTYCC
jgi:hypothetical protein